MVPFDRESARGRMGGAGLPIEDESCMPKAEGHKANALPGTVASVDDVRIFLVICLGILSGRAGPAQAFYKIRGFDSFAERVLGVGPDEAQRLAQRMGTTPPWLAPISRDLEKGATIEEIVLNSSPATLIQETENDRAVKHITVIWSVPDRVYVLSGNLSRELAIATANAVQ